MSMHTISRHADTADREGSGSSQPHNSYHRNNQNMSYVYRRVLKGLLGVSCALMIGVPAAAQDDAALARIWSDGVWRSALDAKARIELITADIEVGRIYEGKVVRIMDFGAFVNILPGKDGLVHISQMSHERVEKVTDMVTEGDVIKVKVLEVDRQGRIRLSIKALTEDAA